MLNEILSSLISSGRWGTYLTTFATSVCLPQAPPFLPVEVLFIADITEGTRVHSSCAPGLVPIRIIPDPVAQTALRALNLAKLRAVCQLSYTHAQSSRSHYREASTTPLRIAPTGMRVTRVDGRFGGGEEVDLLGMREKLW